MPKMVQPREFLRECLRNEQIEIKTLFIHQRSQKSSNILS